MIQKINFAIDKLHEVTIDGYRKIPTPLRKLLNILLVVGVITFLALLIYNMSKTPFQLI